MEEEGRFASTQLTNKAVLTERQRRFANAALENTTPTLRAEPINTPVSLAQLARKFTLQMAQEDVASSADAKALSLLDRLDRETSATLETDCLRARIVRNSAVGSEVSDEAISAYKKCVAWPNANPVFLKELGFLFRYRGNTEAAKVSFENYLLAAPTAVDAPIVRGYIAELSK